MQGSNKFDTMNSSYENQLLPDDLLRSGSDIVHPLHPRHWISCFQTLGNALGGFHLCNQRFHTRLRLLIEVSQICPEGAGEDELIEANGVVRFPGSGGAFCPICRWDGIPGAVPDWECSSRLQVCNPSS